MVLDGDWMNVFLLHPVCLFLLTPLVGRWQTVRVTARATRCADTYNPDCASLIIVETRDLVTVRRRCVSRRVSVTVTTDARQQSIE